MKTLTKTQILDFEAKTSFNNTVSYLKDLAKNNFMVLSDDDGYYFVNLYDYNEKSVNFQPILGTSRKFDYRFPRFTKMSGLYIIEKFFIFAKDKSGISELISFIKEHKIFKISSQYWYNPNKIAFFNVLYYIINEIGDSKLKKSLDRKRYTTGVCKKEIDENLDIESLLLLLELEK